MNVKINGELVEKCMNEMEKNSEVAELLCTKEVVDYQLAQHFIEWIQEHVNSPFREWVSNAIEFIQ